MIPQKLSIEGLYSYQERQTIDFTQLMEGGLFGIFGAVGSGKSSILEAITFALFGDSDRLGGTSFAYNMMNLKSNRLYLEFEFLNSEGKLFKITREYGRNRNNFENVTNKGVVLYEYKSGDWSPMESSNVEPIIGLSSENFRRTIIIPQGKFKEFIDLKPTARTQMMGELYPKLREYDLQDKVAVLNKKNETEVNQLKGKLSGFEMVSEEEISTQKENLEASKSIFNAKKIEFEKISKLFQQLQNLKTDFDLLAKKEVDFSTLEAQKSRFDEKETQLQTYQKVFKAFNDDLKERKRIEEQIKTLENQLKISQDKCVALNKNLSDLTTKKKELQPKIDDLPQQKLLENDLEILFSIKELEVKLAKNKQNTIDGENFVNECHSKEKLSMDEIQKLENDILELKKKQVPTNQLMEVGEWFSKRQNLEQNLSSEQKKLLENKVALQNTEVKIQGLNSETITKEILEFKSKKEELQVRKNKLEVSKQLAHYSNELHDGAACPLCGSLEHPDVATFEDVSKDLIAIEEEILSFNKQIEILEQRKSDFEKLNQEKTMISQQGELLKNGVEAVENQISELEKLFVWKEFLRDDFEHFQNVRKENKKIDEDLVSKEKLLAASRLDLENIRKKLEKAKLRFQEINNENLQFQAKIDSNSQLLKQIQIRDFKDKTEVEIQTQLNDLKAVNSRIETFSVQLISEIQDLDVKLASENSRKDEFLNQKGSFEKSFEETKTKLQKSLSESQFSDFVEVDEILSQSLDENALQKEIQEFKIQFGTLKNEISNLKEKLKGLSFNTEEFLETEKQFLAKEKDFKEANDFVVKISTEINRLEAEFEKKKDLLQQQSKLEKRADNLKEMKRLFDRSGFVQYVSSIYLRQLCDNANVRFHRMTRNQLSLQLNDSNEFEIIDYLNEGRSRSVKTLSGGQAFQVSLSLALALAESVQAHAKAEKNFFFIDEGFGTQDLESVNVVFETLMNLQKENRIVGIISHVEELKERIPMSLTVVKDEEKGSRIFYN